MLALPTSHKEGEHAEILRAGLRPPGQHRQADQVFRQVHEVPGQPRHHLPTVGPGAGHAAGRAHRALGEEGGLRLWMSEDSTKDNISDPGRGHAKKKGHRCSEEDGGAGVEGGMAAADETVPEEVEEILP